MSTLLTVGITVVTTLVYVAGWWAFQPHKGGIGSAIAWLLSPITLPLAFLALYLTG